MDGNKKSMHMIAYILVIIGGLNWLVFGLTGWDVGQIFPGGMMGMIAKIIYVLVGLSAVYEIATHKTRCKECGSMGMGSGSSMDKKPGMSSSM